MHSHRQNPGFGLLCDAVAYRRLVVVTGSGVSVGLAQPGSDLTSLPTWHTVLTQLRSRFAPRLGSVAADVELLLSAQPRGADYLIEAATMIRETVGVSDYRDAVVHLTTAPEDARSPLHDLIEDLEPLGIITFNYDLGHENAYRARRRDRENEVRGQPLAILGGTLCRRKAALAEPGGQPAGADARRPGPVVLVDIRDQRAGFVT